MRTPTRSAHRVSVGASRRCARRARRGGHRRPRRSGVARGHMTPLRMQTHMAQRSRCLSAHLVPTTREHASSATVRRPRLLRAARAPLRLHRTGSCGGAGPGTQQHAWQRAFAAQLPAARARRAPRCARAPPGQEREALQVFRCAPPRPPGRSHVACPVAHSMAAAGFTCRYPHASSPSSRGVTEAQQQLHTRVTLRDQRASPFRQ